MDHLRGTSVNWLAGRDTFTQCTNSPAILNNRVKGRWDAKTVGGADANDVAAAVQSCRPKDALVAAIVTGRGKDYDAVLSRGADCLEY